MKKFHEILKEKRKELNMTQQEFAERLNVSNKTVSKWETGRYYPDITMIASIAKILNITVDELMGADDLSKTVGYEEETNYDKEIVFKFKKNIIIAISLFLSIILLYLNKLISTLVINNPNYISKIGTLSDSFYILETVISILVCICILFSITLFIISVINYRSFYIKKFYNSKYQKLFYRYSLLYFQIIIFLLSFTIYGLIEDINALSTFFIWLLSILLLSIIAIILKGVCCGKFKKNSSSVIIFTLGFISFIVGEILIFFDIFPYILLILFSYIILSLNFHKSIIFNEIL